MGSDEIILLREAAQDIRDGEAFYEKHQKGLGDYFTQGLLSDLESLKIYAGLHVKIGPSSHRMKSKRFPYAIYYRVQSSTAYVLAVLPLRRRPTWVLKTIQTRGD